MHINQNLVYIIIGVVVISVIIRILGKGNSKPPSDDFTCARCKKKELFTNRTIDAWRQGFKKIYCESCHQLWLKSNPYNKKHHQGSGGGCFSVLILVGVIPGSIYLAVKYLF